MACYVPVSYTHLDVYKRQVLNGPNLNLLGTREPATYGHETLADISKLCADTAAEQGLAIEFRQTNHEGEVLDWIHTARGRCAGILRCV